MGWPVDDSYARASGVDNADKLRGHLLLIVGEQDENVDPASTYQVADALIRAGKDFDLLAVPGAGHGVGRGNGDTDRYVQRRKFDFFVRHLLKRQTPDWNQ
jgi:dipeptidyl aminopeptidase/acylaminoacyl peptidase